jgi:hypothetical protein
VAKAVVVNWQVESQVVVNGSLYTQYQVTLVGATGHSMFVPFGTTVARFESIDAGTYMASVALVNDDGSLVGPDTDPVEFDVVDDATLDVPVMVTVGTEGLP